MKEDNILTILPNVENHTNSKDMLHFKQRKCEGQLIPKNGLWPRKRGGQVRTEQIFKPKLGFTSFITPPKGDAKSLSER